MYTDENLPTMDILSCSYVEIQSCSPFRTLIPISLIVLKMPKKSFLQNRPYSEPVVSCHCKVYNCLLNKMKRICFRFQILTCMESYHELHEVLHFAIDSVLNIIDRAGVSPQN